MRPDRSLALITLAAACLPSAASAQPRGGGVDWNGLRGAALYRDADFGGHREIFPESDSDLRNNRIGSDTAGSMRVSPGCRVTLYSEAGYQGRAETFTADVFRLGNTRVGDDSVSSLTVECGGPVQADVADPAPMPWTGQPGAVLYSEADYRGRSEVFHQDVASLAGTRVGNDSTSSVRVAPGCRLELFEGGGFRGVSTVLTGDVRSLRGRPVRDDHASSLRIDCGEPPPGGDPDPRFGDDPGPRFGPGPGSRAGVTLYRDEDFRGASETLHEDVPYLGNTRVGNDAARSVRVESGCRLELFEHADYRGSSVTLTRDASSLRGTRVGIDRASSARVDCSPGHGSGSDDPGYPEPGYPGFGPGGERGGVTLYGEEDFRGASETLHEDVPYLGNTRVGNDAARSVRVAYGCRLELFEHADYRGNTVTLTRDAASLRGTRVGNDRASSARVVCGR